MNSFPPTRFASTVAALGAAILGISLATSAGDDAERVAPRDAKAALAWFNPLVGEWRGAGQVRRGSTAGAWVETGEFVWDFSKGEPAVVYEVEEGKHLASARFGYDGRNDEYVVHATLPDSTKRAYRGTVDGDACVADSAVDDEGWVHRIVVTRLNEKRTLVRYERRREAQRVFARLGEVGATRAGTSLAVEGAGEPECVVTGGRGTMTVSHAGKSYWVCCTGCKQAFEADPEGVITDYERRLAERKAP